MHLMISINDIDFLAWVFRVYQRVRKALALRPSVVYRHDSMGRNDRGPFMLNCNWVTWVTVFRPPSVLQSILLRDEVKCS